MPGPERMLSRPWSVLTVATGVVAAAVGVIADVATSAVVVVAGVKGMTADKATTGFVTGGSDGRLCRAAPA